MQRRSNHSLLNEASFKREVAEARHEIMFVHRKSDELPDVFHLKPLNNQCAANNAPLFKSVVGLPNKQTNIVHNGCVHQCKNSSENEPKTMRLFRLKRSKIIVLLVGLLCFIVGLALPFIYISTRVASSSSPKLSLSSFMRPSQRPLIPVQHKIEEHLLENVFISIKTSRKFHYPRLIVQLETWVSMVKSQTWFFTDDSDANLVDRTNGHLIRTNCSDSHSRVALACKMGAEFDAFLKSHKP